MSLDGGESTLGESTAPTLVDVDDEKQPCVSYSFVEASSWSSFPLLQRAPCDLRVKMQAPSERVAATPMSFTSWRRYHGVLDPCGVEGWQQLCMLLGGLPPWMLERWLWTVDVL